MNVSVVETKYNNVNVVRYDGSLRNYSDEKGDFMTEGLAFEEHCDEGKGLPIGLGVLMEVISQKL